MRFEGKYKSEISFPLGGIGSGSIGLAGNGNLIDIEIKNEPNKCSDGKFTHFAIKAENEKKVVDVRVLTTDLQPGYVGKLERAKYTGYGWGPDRGTMAGFPHFEKGEFEGEFPIAKLDFEDSHFPGLVTMEAFNPFIPSNEDDSSIPGGFFEFEILNTSQEKLTYTVALSCNNYYGNGSDKNTYREQDGKSYLFLSNMGDKETVEYGDLTIATDCEEVSYQEYWYRGSWFDNSSVFWTDFKKFGKLKNRTYEVEERVYEVFKENDIATLAAHVEVEAGESKKVRFVLTWSNPYMTNTWEITDPSLNETELERRRGLKWKNYYATIYDNSMSSAKYALNNFTRLFDDTKLYRDLIFASTLPVSVLDAITANTAILKSTTCLRLEDGSFYGFEGTHPHMGSCEGTCTHVWSYAYALAYLFPKMERTARTLEYTESMQPDGGMGFRVQLPLGQGATAHRPAVDGQYGSVLRVYREYMISGDIDWLRSIWSAIKQTIEYAWNAENPDQWDADKDGIMEGRQHHTLDMELFEANSWLSGMYLAGLKAGALLAEIVGDEDAKKEYLEVFEKGKKFLNEELFNGKYFYQKVDLNDKALIEKYSGGVSVMSQDVLSSYWSDEHSQMKYQVGEGVSIDQALGQWHADLLGIGEIFEKEKLEVALQSIYNHNFVRDMRNHVNPCRIYALNDEKGLLICGYPEDSNKPTIPVPYAEETMHGFEYAAASHMIMHGLEEQGLECVKAIRDRYDGERRNPWSEMECGSGYARSMASYALLLIYSGFTCDLGVNKIGFKPLHQNDGTYFWSVDSGFGSVSIVNNSAVLDVAYGTLTVKEMCLNEMTEGILLYNEDELLYNIEGKDVVLKEAVELKSGDCIKMIV